MLMKDLLLKIAMHTRYPHLFGEANQGILERDVVLHPKIIPLSAECLTGPSVHHKPQITRLAIYQWLSFLEKYNVLRSSAT